MKPGIEEEFVLNEPVESQVPGPADSVMLAMDALLALFQLFRSEAALALAGLPQLLRLSLLRIPLYLLAWISFGVLGACAVYTLTSSMLLALAGFFLLQLMLLTIIESRIRELSGRFTFPESRLGLAMMQQSFRERLFQHEDRS